MHRLAVPFALAALALFPSLPAGAQKDPTSRSWNQPVEPYKILGNVYYVGASDIASYLITTPQGHILLDGGFEETVPIIRESVKKLGFKIEDVKILINSHAHYDHAGGLAELKKLTGAKFYASEKDAPLHARGGLGDFALGDRYPYPPIQADRLLKDGDTVTLGGVTLTAHLTPGHTPGNTTWTMKAKDGGKSYNVAFVGSMSILPGVSLTSKPSYPGIADDFATSLRVLKSLPCEVFLAPHAGFFNGPEKAERLKKGETPNPFIDPQGCQAYIKQREKVYQDQLAKERQKNP
ncbi:MAG TPA: subclass B3 metallo-beta-lactamase [Thermoanaerobaculia bacterium]|nr:subclass B3 metallo-beta-lactamase [Thermoanaerobaculia bacterium]